jgi:hypothetical protein
MSSPEAVTASTPEVPETPEVTAAPAAAKAARTHAAPMTASGALNVGFGLILGLFGTILAYNRAPALGFALYVFLLIGALFLSARLQRTLPVRRNLFIVVPVLFFAAMLAVRSDPVLIVFNLLVATFAALLLVYYFANGNLAQQDFIGYGLKSALTALVVDCPVDELIHCVNGWQAPPEVAFLLPFVRVGDHGAHPDGVRDPACSADTVFNKFVRTSLTCSSSGRAQFGRLRRVRAVMRLTAVGGLAYALGIASQARDPLDNIRGGRNLRTAHRRFSLG